LETRKPHLVVILMCHDFGAYPLPLPT
jgi:hypothetical protein